jgi:ribosome recycling factor
VDTHIPNNAATRNKDSAIDPHDLSELEAGIAKALDRLRAALVKTKDAGRVTPENLESLPVELAEKEVSASGKEKTVHQKQSVRLGDIASVAPKGGRTLQVFASDEAHLKSLLSAISASTYSLTPQPPGPDAANPLCITVPIPPVTTETRQQAAAEAKKCLEKASGEIRLVRGEAQKRFRRMEIEKLAGPDDVRKAQKAMEEFVRKGNAEAKEVVDRAAAAALKG